MAAPLASGRSQASRCAPDPNRATTSATSELLTDRIAARVALAPATVSMAAA